MRPHLDKNHRPIMKELQQQGIEVVEVFKPLDMLVFRQGFTGWVEVKKPNSSSVFTRPQIVFMAATRMPVVIAHEAMDVIAFIKAGVGLSQRQKDALAAFLLKDDRKQWHHQLIERILDAAMERRWVND